MELKLGFVKLGAAPSFRRPDSRRPESGKPGFEKSVAPAPPGVSAAPRPHQRVEQLSAHRARVTVRSGAVRSPRTNAGSRALADSGRRKTGRRKTGRLKLGAVKLGAETGRRKTGRAILGWHDPLRIRGGGTTRARASFHTHDGHAQRRCDTSTTAMASATATAAAAHKGYAVLPAAPAARPGTRRTRHGMAN